MKKSLPLFICSMLILTQRHVFAGVEIFPFSAIRLGMSSMELLEKFPADDIFVPKQNDDGALERGLVYYNISGHDFWGALGVQVLNSKVNSLNYLPYSKNMYMENPEVSSYENLAEKINPLYERLKQELGISFERRTKYHSATREIGQVVYVWQRENDVVALSHNPLPLYVEGDFFNYLAIIAPTYEVLNASYVMTTNNVLSNEHLWLGVNKEGGTPLTNTLTAIIHQYAQTAETDIVLPQTSTAPAPYTDAVAEKTLVEEESVVKKPPPFGKQWLWLLAIPAAVVAWRLLRKYHKKP